MRWTGLFSFYAGPSRIQTFKDDTAMLLTHSQTKERRRIHASEALPFLPDDAQVLSFRQWCSLNGISARTGMRILRGSDGPTVTRLSARRIGITKRNNRTWQASRASKA
jgi:hypothetical protein